MATVNWDYQIASRVKTVLESLTTAPDVVQIVPAGAEQSRPNSAQSFWANVAIQDNGIILEPSAYIGTTLLQVSIGIESTALLPVIAETLSAAATASLHALATSALAGYVRQYPEVDLIGYSGGEDNNSIYWYEFTVLFEHQEES